MGQSTLNLNSSEKAQVSPPPELGGIRFGPALTGTLYLLLVGSAALALWARQVPGAIPAYLEATAPWVFLIFVACFALYRFGLIRARKYPVFKAFFQIGAALLFFMLLFPQPRRVNAAADPLEGLFGDSNARVRALAAEVVRYRPNGARYTRQLIRSLDDADPEVREQAHRSLVQVAGTDLGRSGEPWKKRFP